MNKFIVFNFFHNNHLRIFQKKIDYFRLTNEKNLSIIKNFRKIRKKIMQKTQKKKQKKKRLRSLLNINQRYKEIN